MNMFRPVSCIDLKEESIEDFLGEDMNPSYNGPIVILENIEWTSLFLFFPVSKRNMTLINQTMAGSRDIKSLSIYKTMTDSWKGSGNYLSGIIMDLNYDDGNTEQRVSVNFALAGNDGKLKSLIPVSFVDAIITSIILEQDIMVGNKLFALMNPDQPEAASAEWGTDESHPYPDDENLAGVVKGILDGKVKGSKEPDPEDEDEDPEEE